MIVDAVEAPALGIKGAEPRRVLVGLPPELGSGRTPGNPAESGEVFSRVGRTLTRDRLAQRGIRREQVHVGKGRALVEHLLALRNWIGRHGLLCRV
jgi:hypothetical protein